MNSCVASVMRRLDLHLTRHRRLAILLMLLTGIALPFLIVALVPIYHKADLTAFSNWADCLGAFGKGVILQCGSDRTIAPINYPTIGLLLSGGVKRAIDTFAGSSVDATIGAFRYYIAAFASAAFLLLALLARVMRFSWWPAVALLILVIPSTLVNAVIWGQLDGISLVFCLAAFLGLLTAQSSAARCRLWTMTGWTAVGAFSLAILLLLKPLNTFTLPFFAFQAFVVAASAFRNFRIRGLAMIGLTWFVALSIFRYLDTRFVVPPGFWGSTFWYSWTSGASPHANVIAANGFNLWVLLGRDMLSSSNVPFAEVGVGTHRLVLTPYQTGLALYALFLLLTFTVAVRYASIFLPPRRGSVSTTVGGERMGATELPASWHAPLLCLLFALTQIGFNVFLTGTHERYLFLGYPFLLIGLLWLASRRVAIGWRGFVACLVVAFLHGLFVYNAMYPLPGLFFIAQNPAGQATLHILLLVFVFDIWLQVVRAAAATGDRSVGRR